jgi:hypothetical protein
MFAWLLIAIELAFLYLAYWFVFVREPKNIQIEGQLWGGYDSSTYKSFEHNVLDFPEQYGDETHNGGRAA